MFFIRVLPLKRSNNLCFHHADGVFFCFVDLFVLS